ncbi:hypothetical protein RIF29_38004 [Crotalaria pallida]|uniref:Uncharacterized protein n=1 Tax=Crotalaria pallida TaxID=3830 RepID=A0AAN9DYB7_CROPI
MMERDMVNLKGTIRRPPNEDKEVIMGVMEAFKMIADDNVENGEEARMLRAQFATFHQRRGFYAMAPAQADNISPYSKWDINPEETIIDDFAIKLQEMKLKSLDGDYIHMRDFSERDKDTPLETFTLTSIARFVSNADGSSRGVRLQQAQISSFETKVAKGKGKRYEE